MLSDQSILPIWASGSLSVYRSIWASSCLDVGISWHQAIWLRFWSGCLIIGSSDQIWPQERQVSCHPDKDISGHWPIWLTFHLSIDLAIWTSSYLDIDLPGHQAIWTSGYLFFCRKFLKDPGTGYLGISMPDHWYGSWDQILPQEFFRHRLADRSGHSVLTNRLVSKFRDWLAYLTVSLSVDPSCRGTIRQLNV